jgi:hypothetical protein
LFVKDVSVQFEMKLLIVLSSPAQFAGFGKNEK